MDPASAPLAGRIAARLRARLDEFAAAAARVRRDADGEAVHDARVTARHLAEELALWGAAFDERAVRRARRAVRRLRTGLGASREAEVHRALLEDLLPGLDDDARTAAGPLLERLRREEAKGRAKAARAAREDRVERVRERVEAALAAGSAADAAGVHEHALAHVARRAEGARRALALTAGSDDDALLHEARIAIKKARYAEVGRAALDPSAGDDPSPSPRIEALRRLQQLLGEAHDRASLIAWIATRERRDGSGAPAGASLLVARLANERRKGLRALPRRLAALAAESPPPA